MNHRRTQWASSLAVNFHDRNVSIRVGADYLALNIFLFVEHDSTRGGMINEVIVRYDVSHSNRK